MLKKNSSKRLVSILILVAFGYSSIAWSAPEFSIRLSHQNSLVINPSFLEIPSNLGFLKENTIHNLKTPLVVLIQDAHAIPEAQTNIKALIEFLRMRNESSEHPRPFHVFSENASGLLNSEQVRLFPESPDIERQAIERLTSLGELSGVELFAIENSAVVLGVEDRALHQENLKQFRKLLSSRSQIDLVLSKLETKLRQKIKEKLNPALSAFVLERQARTKDQRELLPYLKSLSESVYSALKIDLLDAREQLRFPNLTRLLHIKQLESSFDFEAAGREWERFLTKLTLSVQGQGVVQEISEIFRKKTFDHLSRPPRLYLEWIALFEEKSKQNIELFPNLQKTLASLTLQSEIDSISLFNELNHLESEVERVFIQNESEKEVLTLRDQFEMVAKLVRGEIIREEFLKLNKAQLLKSLYQIDTNLSASVDGWIACAFQFYEGALRREETLVHNLLSNLNLRESPIAVLVAGGFHTSGIIQLLNQKKIAYAVIAPKISQLPDAHLYRDVMLGKNANTDSSTIYRTLLLSPDSGEAGARVITGAYEFAFRSELRGKTNSSFSIGVIGLDATGHKLIEHYRELGYRSEGFGWKEVSSDNSDKLAQFLQKHKVIVVNSDPTAVSDPSKFQKDIRDLVDKLAQTTKQVQTSAPPNETDKKIFVFRSVVPFRGEPTAVLQLIHNKFRQYHVTDFEVVYQPTFLRKDPSIDEVRNEQTVFGTLNGNDTDGSRTLKLVYGNKPVTVTSAKTAEITQYFTTLYLAKKIVAFNELMRLVDKVGGDLNAIALIAGLDSRILTAHSKVGLGFSGTLQRITQLVRDRIASMTQRFEGFSRIVSQKLKDMLDELLKVNARQVEVLQSQIKEHERSLFGKKVVLMGIANRSGSIDLSGSPALELIKWLSKEGVQSVSIYDPYISRDKFDAWWQELTQADSDFLWSNPQFITTDSALDAQMKESHFSVIGMHHPEINNLDLTRLSTNLNGHILYDGWNVFGLQTDGSSNHSLEEVRAAGINYVSMGRPPVGPRFSKIAVFESRLITKVSDLPIPEAGKESKKIAVIGTGYVGLVQGTELAESGHQVIGVDINPLKIEMLNQGQSPIYEPGLDTLLDKHRGKTLQFTTDLKAAVRTSQAVFIGVGTPSDIDGSIDLSYVVQAASDVGAVITRQKQESGAAIPASERKIIVIKSTVTPDVFQEISKRLQREHGLILGEDYALASNPEFLREGQALKDVQYPDRIAFGIDPRMNPDAIRDTERFLLELIRPRMEFLEREAAAGKKVPPVRVVITDTISAPLGKYLANSYLAGDISFSNVAARIVRILHGSWLEVARIMRRDARISNSAFLGAGVGYGGSCFPKDVKALLAFMKTSLVPSNLLELVEGINHWVKEETFVTQVVESIFDETWDKTIIEKPLEDRQIGIWGLAFKPDTDDVREAPSFDIVLGVLRAGAKVKAHDPLPQARQNFLNVIKNYSEVSDPKKRARLSELNDYLQSGQLEIVSDKYEAVHGSSALILVTEWDEYSVKSEENPKGIDLTGLRQIFVDSKEDPVVIAGRDSWDGREFSDAGFYFHAVSQPDRRPDFNRSELRASRTFRKAKRWLRNNWIKTILVVSVPSLATWYGYYWWKISQDPLAQAQKAMQNAKGVALPLKHNSIKFTDNTDAHLLANPFMQDKIDEALSNLRITDGVTYSDIVSIEFTNKNSESRHEEYPYVARLKMRGEEPAGAKFVDLRAGDEQQIPNADKIQVLILGRQHANFVSKKVRFPKVLLILSISIPAVLIAGILGEAFAKLRRNQLYARERRADIDRRAGEIRHALSKAGQTGRQELERRSELRSKNEEALISEKPSQLISYESVRSELRLVQRATSIAERFAPSLTFLDKFHPDLVDPVTGTRSELRKSLVDSAFASVRKPVAIHSQVIRVIDASDKIDVSEFTPALETIIRSHTKLVILLTNDTQNRAAGLHRELSDQLSLVAAKLDKSGIDRSAQIVVQSVDQSEERLAAVITQSYLTTGIREKSAVVTEDSDLLYRVRPALRFLNDLEESDSALRANALIQVIQAANDPLAVKDRFEIISLDAWLGTRLSEEHRRDRTVRVSA